MFRNIFYWYLIVAFVLAGLIVLNISDNPAPGLILLLISAGLWWKYTEPQRKVEEVKQQAELQMQQEIEQESLRQKETLLNQKELEKNISEQNTAMAENVAKIALRNHINLISNHAMMIPSKEGNDMALSAINESINDILADSNIKSAYFKEASVQRDWGIIFEHLNQCGLSNHLVVKRLRSLFKEKRK